MTRIKVINHLYKPSVSTHFDPDPFYVSSEVIEIIVTKGQPCKKRSHVTMSSRHAGPSHEDFNLILFELQQPPTGKFF